MEKTFFGHSGPMLVGIVRQRTVREAIAEIKNGEALGATGFDLHLDALDPEARTEDELRRIFSSTELPILALNYRNGFFGPIEMDEDERVGTLLTAVRAGAAAIDLQGYSFDPNARTAFHNDDLATGDLAFLTALRPKEVTLEPTAIERQRRTVETVHEAGAEVMTSMHFGVHLPIEALLAVSRFVSETRGIDAVKLVATCSGSEELADCLAATIRLKKELGFPFTHHLTGKAGHPTRYICPMLGSYMTFCNVSYGPSSNMEQLYLSGVADAYRKLGVSRHIK